MKFTQAKFYTPTGVGRKITRVVMHTTQNDLRPGMAQGVANFFQNQQVRAAGSSAHYVVDGWETIQCVAERDVAWAAPGANKDSIHIELVGRAEWSPWDWNSEAAKSMLQRAAALCADICKRYGLPANWLDVNALKAGNRGVSNHDNCSKAFGGNHWDPGVSFPTHAFMGSVQDAIRGLAPPPPEQQFAPIVYYPPVEYGDNVKRIDVKIPLDDGGNGWATLTNVDAGKVVGFVPLGPFPPRDKGYWTTPRFARQQRDADTIITAVNGNPKGSADVSVWVVD